MHDGWLKNLQWEENNRVVSNVWAVVIWMQTLLHEQQKRDVKFKLQVRNDRPQLDNDSLKAPAKTAC